MNHLLIIDPNLTGREYGTLSSFQEAIIKITFAETVFLPVLGFWEKKFLQTSKFRILRKFLFRKKIIHDVGNIDVLWYILMGPENYRLDLFSGYENVSTKIIYFFDTLPHQFKLIKLLNLDRNFDYKITSFLDAKDVLERLTHYEWNYWAQASICRPQNFQSFHNKNIAFSSYGRKVERLNQLIKKFCDINSLHFDYNHESPGSLRTNNIDLYNNYLWHTSQSVFNVCFSVEITDPDRSGILSPITCRWFEAILSRNIVVGIPPRGKEFDNYFPSNFVQQINLECSDEVILEQINNLWINREEIYNSIYSTLSDDFFLKFQWEYRVREICNSLL